MKGVARDMFAEPQKIRDAKTAVLIKLAFGCQGVERRAENCPKRLPFLATSMTIERFSNLLSEIAVISEATGKKSKNFFMSLAPLHMTCFEGTNGSVSVVRL